MSGKRSPIVFAAAVTLSAFLLFQVQLVVAKGILPQFGGSSSVWTTCMMFFQVLLVAGYSYAHLTSILACRTQAIVHFVLLAVCAGFIELVPARSESPSLDQPAMQILATLLPSVGPAFFLLSAHAPLLQRWFAFITSASPYRLYALSNVGSLLGLLSYPFLFEPLVSLSVQQSLWRGGFVILTLLIGAIAWRLPSGVASASEVHAPDEKQVAAPEQRPTWQVALLWFLLAAAPSALLLSVTNKVSTDIAAFPLLWVLPLSLYLITFVIAFDSPRWYLPRTCMVAMVAGLWAIGKLVQSPTAIPIVWTAGVYYAGMFACCLACHGELARLRPSPRYLTLYFMIISLGGAVGAAAVAMIAPRVFTYHHELPLALVACLMTSIVAASLRGGSLQPLDRLTMPVMLLVGGLTALAWLSPALVTSPVMWVYQTTKFASLLYVEKSDALAIYFAAIVALALVFRWTWSPILNTPSTSWLSSTIKLAAGGVAVLLALTLIGPSVQVVNDSAVSSSRLLFNPLLLWFCGVVALYAVDRSWPRWMSQRSENGNEPRRAGAANERWLANLLVAVPWLMFFASLLKHFLIDRNTSWLAAGAVVALLPLVCNPAWVSGPGPRRIIGAIAIMAGAIPVFHYSWTWTSSNGNTLLTHVSWLVLELATSSLIAAYLKKNPATTNRQDYWQANLVGIMIAALATTVAYITDHELLCIGAARIAAMLVGASVWLPGPASQHDRKPFRHVILAATLIAVATVHIRPTFQWSRATELARVRNFYGLLRVEEEHVYIASSLTVPVRRLVHGQVVHGLQYVEQRSLLEPTTYYTRDSGIGQLLTSLPKNRPQKIGVIGLGVGTLATYAKPDDAITFFELDPDVIAIAGKHFTFLEQSAAKIEIVPGDGRLSLERNTAGPFDVLVVDAFSGDAVPVHLLTHEAIELYLRHLADDGYLALHITNTHLDLSPVINEHAEAFRLNKRYDYCALNGSRSRSLWVLLSRRPIDLPVTSIPDGVVSDRRLPWHDQHHSL